MPTIVLATCTAWPALSAGDAPLAEALAARHGVAARAARWNAAEDQPLFAAADLVVLRSTWDYQHAPAAFVAWLAELDTQKTVVLNPPALVRWNLDKSYLLDLAVRGATIPRTLLVADEAAAVRAAVARFDGAVVVLKPAVGAAGDHVYRATAARLEEVIAALQEGAPEYSVLVQEFLPEIHAGECALVFIDGAFTHAFLRQPATDRRLAHDPTQPEFRVNSQHGARVSLIQGVPSEQIAQARALLDLLPELPLYARVDGVVRGGTLLVTELELIEPGLRLDLFATAADRFADAIVARLG